MKRHAHRWLGLSRLVLCTSALMLVATTSATAQDLPPGAAGVFEDNGEQEGDLNCDEIRMQRSGLRGIVQNISESGPSFSARMRLRGKVLFNGVVLAGNTAAHSYHEQGVLYGVEFDWFFPTDGQPPTSYRLPGVTNAYVVLGNGTRRLVAKVYSYTQEQYEVRRSEIEAMVGHPMRSFPVWAEDVASAGSESLLVTGFENEFFGVACSAEDAGLLGVQNVLHGGLVLGGRSTIREPNTVAGVYHRDALAAPAAPFTLDEARAIAKREGTYVTGDLLVTAADLPPAGVVFAEGSIVLATDAVVGTWTLVSPGKVVIRGDGNALQPHLARTLAFSGFERVSVSGDGNAVLGELHAGGTLEVSGSDNTLLGILVGAGVRVTGSANRLSDGTHPIQLP